MNQQGLFLKFSFKYNFSSLNSFSNEERYTILEDLRFGRFSFNGQNPEIEVFLIKIN